MNHTAAQPPLPTKALVPDTHLPSAPADFTVRGDAPRVATGRTRRPATLAASAVLTGLALACAAAMPASARPDETSADHPSSAQPASVGRIGRLIVRCNDHDGELGGEGVLAPLTLPVITSCATPSPAAPAWVRQLEHNPLR